jgi:hypothetical protein
VDRSFVYLSDGGHFENLGSDEMVRRRCRFIVVSDAGCDPKFALDDLANAVRKISIDLGVEIHFAGLENLRPRGEDDADVGPNQPYHAIGEVDYASADDGGENGLILYIKAGYHGCEGAGVRGFAKANPDFPHQSTIDQWFTESQFESYRALGFEITDSILRRSLADPGCGGDSKLEAIFAAQATATAGRSISIERRPRAHEPNAPAASPACASRAARFQRASASSSRPTV